MDENTKMNAKRNLVSFVLIASVLFLAASVSAYIYVGGDLADDSTIDVYVDGITVVEDGGEADSVSVIAGDTISVKVVFIAEEDASDVRIRAELEGETEDITESTGLFDVEEGKTYTKTLTLKVPAEFDDDELSQDITLNIKISNSDYETEVEEVLLNVQRPSYDIAIKSVNVDNTVDAGEKVPVEFVLKNIGYNEAEDVEVTVSIPELGIEKTAWLGDIVTEPYEDSWFSDDDDDCTVSGKLTLEIPYDTQSGIYNVVVTASNDETEDNPSQKSVSIMVENSVSNVAIKSGNDLILVNPTDSIKVYRVLYQSTDTIVVVPAGQSKTVQIEVPTGEDYDFDVAVYSEESLLSTVKFSGSAQSEVELTSPVFMLTVILAVVFLVLLVVLIVLITKKPQKAAEEFGESYY